MTDMLKVHLITKSTEIRILLGYKIYERSGWFCVQNHERKKITFWVSDWCANLRLFSGGNNDQCTSDETKTYD